MTVAELIELLQTLGPEEEIRAVDMSAEGAGRGEPEVFSKIEDVGYVAHLGCCVIWTELVE